VKFPRHRCRLEIFADYFQFYLWDSDTRQAPESWTDNNVQNRMHVAPGVVVVCPIRNMTVSVEISIWDAEPNAVLADWQHVVEAPLELERDNLEVYECCGQLKAQFTMPRGKYIVRGLFRGLDKLSEDHLEGDDFYEVQVWPGELSSLRLLKKWPA
jgi:hypothetical protein